jgi:serine/threonine-protein kinase HipA
MNQRAKVYAYNKFAGILEEHDGGTFSFTYNDDYLASQKPKPVSLTLPLLQHKYESASLFAFFDGLIPEGWMLNLAVKNWKLDRKDRMGILIKSCRDCIGSVHIEHFEGEINDSN